LGTVPLIEMLKEAALRTGALRALTGVGTRGNLPEDVLIERLLLIEPSCSLRARRRISSTIRSTSSWSQRQRVMLHYRVAL
jgi:hypothetical protein